MPSDDGDELPSAQEIEAAVFPDASPGYDKVRVDVYLRAVARSVRSLERQLEAAGGGPGAIFRAAGPQLAELMEHAADAAASARAEAKSAGAAIVDAAAAKARATLSEAESLAATARQEAERVLQAAHGEAQRLREEGTHTKRLAEVRASIAGEEQARELRRIREEARAKAAAIQDEAVAAKEVLEGRIRELRSFEARLTRRIRELVARMESLQDDVREATGEPDEPEGEPAPPRREPDTIVVIEDGAFGSAR